MERGVTFPKHTWPITAHWCSRPTRAHVEKYAF